MPRLPLLLLLAAVVTLPAPAFAHDLLDNDQLKLSLGGFIQGGYAVSDRPAAGLEHGPYLGLLRVVAEARHKRWGRAFVQVGADSGQLELLPARPVELDRQLDAAVVYKAHRFTGYLKGVLVLDEPGGYRPFSVYAALLKDFPIPYREVSLEPGLRYELARRDARWLQRLTANLTFYAIGDYLNVSANYELLIDADVVGHAGYARI